MLRGLRPKGVLSVEHIEQIVAIREQRKGILSQSAAPGLHAVVDEAALRRLIGSDGVMARQLEYLLDAASHPTITIQIHPFTGGPYPGMDGAYCLLEFDPDTVSDVVYVEGLFGEFFVESDETLRLYRKAFESTVASALSPDQSETLIREALQAYEAREIATQ
jgi:hypothetical protein